MNSNHFYKSSEILRRIQDYLLSGGMVNPELANHKNVRDLLIDCKDYIKRLMSILQHKEHNIEYPNKIQKFYFGKLNWCGCRNPTETLEFLRDVLFAIQNKIDNEWNDDSIVAENKLLPMDNALALSYRYQLDVWGLTEHNGSVNNVWLTDYGEEILKLLQSCNIEEAMA